MIMSSMGRTLSTKDDKSQYKKLIAIAIPMMVQNGISNFVNLLDNLMIGRVGGNALSGVALANQIMFVYFLMIFGATAGVGIFTAQYHGKGDNEGIRNTFRFKIVLNTILSAICTVVLLFSARFLINLFLQGEGDPADTAEALDIGVRYMRIMLCSLIVSGLTQAYAGTLRDLGRTKAPMVASVVAILVNLLGNTLLIYGYCGFPKLGADGAAIATVISRFVELAILIVYTGKHPTTFPFIVGAFKNIRLPRNLAKKLLFKALPLMANETLWSLGMTMINQCFSYRSYAAVEAMSIQSTIWNLMSVTFMAMGEAVGIVMGHILGAGELQVAKKRAVKMRWITVLCAVVFGVLSIGISPFFPLLYKTGDDIRHLATGFIIISSALMPLGAYNHASYFIIRSGGNAMITVIFDAVYTWCIAVPVAFVLSRFTGIGILYLFAIVQCLEVVKCFIAFLLVRSDMWIKNIVKE